VISDRILAIRIRLAVFRADSIQQAQHRTVLQVIATTVQACPVHESSATTMRPGSGESVQLSAPAPLNLDLSRSIALATPPSTSPVQPNTMTSKTDIPETARENKSLADDSSVPQDKSQAECARQDRHRDTRATPPTPPYSADEDLPPPPVDWLATRSQLLPRRNQGNKADWIRGWSAAVSSHGNETYCACSEAFETSIYLASSSSSSSSKSGGKRRISLGRKASGIVTAVREILLPRSGLNNLKPSGPPQVCPNCSRPPSPPTSIPSSSIFSASEKLSESIQLGTSRLTKRVSIIFKTASDRARNLGSGRRSSSQQQVPRYRHRDDHDEPIAYQPRWATATQGNNSNSNRRSLPPVNRSRTQPIAQRKSHGSLLDVFSKMKGGGEAGGRVPQTSSTRRHTLSGLSELSDSDNSDFPSHGGAGLAKRLSRLQRAAALLHRSHR
jgi:hypothetical protein